MVRAQLIRSTEMYIPMPLYSQQNDVCVFVGGDVMKKGCLEQDLVKRHDQLIHLERVRATGTCS